MTGHRLFPLVWRTDFCAHLVITGHCPLRTDQVIVSKADAAVTGWRIGSQIRHSGWPVFTVTGIYQPPNVTTDYWVLHATTYSPPDIGRRAEHRLWTQCSRVRRR